MIKNIEDYSVNEYADRVRSLLNSEEKKIYIFTFGCQQNEADSEKILGLARLMGFSETQTPDDADMVILNTCAIREHAETKALSMLGRFKALKKKNPDLIVGFCGCMAAQTHIVDLLKNDFHYVSFTLEPNKLYEIPRMVYLYYTEKRRSFIFNSDVGDVVEGMPAVRKNQHRAWLSIMYGCNNFCSYCIVPYTRGRERSRSSTDVIAECKALISNGVKEITLLGQNVNSYKSDIDFPELLEKIADLDGDFIIRFMTSHPKDVSERLIKVMAEHNSKVAPYFHLPLQSGSDSILRKMNRTYSKQRFLEVAEKIKASVAGVALSTDVIVGFPGESEADFEQTLSVIKSVGFDLVYAFEYSPRKGTPAEKLPDQVSKEVKNQRLTKLLDIQDKISLERNKAYEGTEQRVLVDSMSKKSELCTVSARTASNKLVHFPANENYIGKFVNVKIVKAGAFDLIAEEIK